MVVAVAVVLVVAVTIALTVVRRRTIDGDSATKRATLLPYVGREVVLELEHHPGAGAVFSRRSVHGTVVGVTRSVVELHGGTDRYVSLFLIRRATLVDGPELGSW